MVVPAAIFAMYISNSKCPQNSSYDDKTNPLGDRFVMTVLGCRSSLLVINQVLRIIQIAVKLSDVKTGRI